MKIDALLKDTKFHYFFSFILGVGVVCILRPMCSGKECTKEKAPAEKDFDQYVYQYKDKCYEYKTKTVTCPSSGAIEAFQNKSSRRDGFMTRDTPIPVSSSASSARL